MIGAVDLTTGEKVVMRQTVGSRALAIDTARNLQGSVLRIAIAPWMDGGRWMVTVYERPKMVREAEWLADLPAECQEGGR